MKKWDDILPQYHFSKSEFKAAIFNVFLESQWQEFIDSINNIIHTISFIITVWNGMLYIIHRWSGVMIICDKDAKQKNVCMCNNVVFTLAELIEFMKILKIQLLADNIIKQ